MEPKKLKFIKILLYIFIAAGIILILWPVYTNFIASREVSSELSEWDEENQIISQEENGDAGEEQITGEVQEETGDTEDVPIMDLGDDNTTIESESALTAEDFFPMKITIPKIELEYVVLEGTDTATLKKAAGHESITPLPGEEGRCTISGHRTTYGSPFNRVDELEEGDLIYLETLDNRIYVYAVTAQQIVKPTDVWILEGTEKRELLLTTCHPKYSAATRLIIISELVEIFPFDLGA